MPKQSVAKTTPPLSDDQLAALRTLMPQAFTEGKIDPEKLRATLGDLADDRPERYSFSWAGKRDAIRLLQAPSRATLVPCPEESLTADGTACHPEERSDEGSPRNKETLRAFGAHTVPVSFRESDRQSQNLFIEGDNLEVLKLLYKPYFGRVKMIYIDPPYNTGNDFVYPDNFADPLETYLQLTGQKDSAGNLLTSNPETGGRYHSAWLSMMYPRLFLARQLLREDGVIMVSIDDKEVFDLRLLLNEIFGEENFVDTIIWKKRYGGGAKEKYLVSVHEYIVFYAKNKEALSNIFIPLVPESIERYYKYKDDKYPIRGPYRTHPLEATKSMGERKNLVFPIPSPDGTDVWPKRQWLWSKDRALKARANNELEFIKGNEGWTVHTKQYLKDENGVERQSKAFSIIDDVYTQHGTNEIIDLFGDAQIFAFPKPTGLIKPILQIATEPDSEDIILDFFAGSCSTAQAMLELNREDGGNRRFIMVQLPEPTGNKQFPTIAEIGKERIRRVAARMKDLTPGPSPKGRGEQARQLGMPLETRATPEDLGFKVFKLAPSNYKQWVGADLVSAQAQPDADAYARQAEMFADPLVEGWQPENVLYEVALKEGYGLNIVVEDLTGLGDLSGLYRVADPDKGQSFYFTLAGKIALKDLRPLDLKKDDLFICRDSALDDEAAANLALQCRLKTI
jgi:adenine-specific DNA-methyltransferase